MLNRSSCTNNLQTTIVSTEAESRPDISLRVAECSEPWRGTNFLNDLNIVDKSIYLDIEEDFDPLDELSPENPAEAFINDSNDGWDIAPEEDRIKYILHNIESPDVRKAMRPVLTSFIKVFRKELPNEPSLLPPFKLELNEHNDWFIDRTNKRPARIQAIVKQQEVRKFIKKALTIGLIRPSQAQSWSQVLLTPKKDTGKWRFCIDFRSLNNASKPLGWPIPNIKHMLTRIGNKKAKYFAVIDLTQGYYQISLDETSKEYTAFRTADGLFEWNRLGMGLKGAGSYFQFHMQNTVLIDLLYDILEAYLDDIITWGLTIEELVSNLTQIFARFEKWNIFVNPDKVKFGLTHVEYVGSVIDQHGMHFSPEKREKVLDFKLPRTAKDMKSFLGLTGQFRDHVEHYGELAAPLHTLCDNYNKKNPTLIEWTEQLQQQFSAFQDAVATCPKLFFMDDISPIYLHTDASNVGIGAYLHQQVDARRVPIQFISKTLTKTERKWDTVEKEAYAIFYAFNKLEYLLRDRTFTLRTDAKNLTYINTEHKPKVQRWKLAIQHFDFKVEHIPGIENVEADCFSRWRKELEQDGTSGTEQNTLSLQLMEIEHIPQKDTIPSDIYEKIKSVHNKISGHNGVQRTIDLIVRANIPVWRGMRKHVSTFIKQCAICQKMSAQNIGSQINPFTLACLEPMQRIYIDSIGPIFADANENDNNYILVIIDAFSRFLQVYPTRSVTAKEALIHFNNWIANFGCPSEITTDNGTQFANELISDFCELANISTKAPFMHTAMRRTLSSNELIKKYYITYSVW